MAENEMNKGLSQVSIRLVQESPLLSDESINTPEQAVKVLGEWLEGMDRELVCVLNLQADLKPINMNIVSMGALNEAQVHPREVMKSAILSNAACMMLLHNHPSGSLKPSKEDVKVTDMMHQVGNLLQIPLVDHIIIGKNKQFYSIRDQEDYDISKPSYISDINQLKWPQTMLKEEQFYQDKSNASENKARKLEEIMDELEQGVQSILTSENYMNYLKFLSSFHSYSLNNTILIYHQKPDASLVAGYRKWQSLGRQVRKGEKGIKIIAPAPVKVMTERQKIDSETGEPVKDENGNPVTEEASTTIPRFKVSTVFDLGQTEGEEIPQIKIPALMGGLEGFDNFMKAIREISPVPIRFDNIGDDAKGYYHIENREIVLQVAMSEKQTMKTAIHECAHAILHNKEQQDTEPKDRKTKEIEAESVAFTVCNYFGLDTSDYSFPYIATWGSDREMKELKESMNVIKQTASDFIDKLESRLYELQLVGYYYVSDQIAGSEWMVGTFTSLENGLDAYFDYNSRNSKFGVVLEATNEKITLLHHEGKEVAINNDVFDKGELPQKTWNSILQQVNQAVSEYNVDAKKQDLRIEFYVAECGAFPVVGEYHDKIASFEEAIALYEKIPEERMDACKTLGFDFYTDGEEYGGRYELITGNRLIGPTSENPYLTKPAISQAIKDAKNYLEQKEKSLEKQGKHLEITERSKTLPTKKVKEQER